MHEVAIIGSPDTVAARLAALHDKLGFGSVQLVVTGYLGNLPQTEVVRTIELFAKGARSRLEPMLVRGERRAAAEAG